MFPFPKQFEESKDLKLYPLRKSQMKKKEADKIREKDNFIYFSVFFPFIQVLSGTNDILPEVLPRRHEVDNSID